MKKEKKKGLIGTFVLHLILLVLLFVFVIQKPQVQEEGGVPVLLEIVKYHRGMPILIN